MHSILTWSKVEWERKRWAPGKKAVSRAINSGRNELKYILLFTGAPELHLPITVKTFTQCPLDPTFTVHNASIKTRLERIEATI